MPTPPPVGIHGLGTDVRLAISPDASAEIVETTVRTLWARCLDDRPPEDAPEMGVFLTDERPHAGPDSSLPVATCADLDQLMIRTTQLITRMLIDRRIGELLMFHAGGVAHPGTGRSLVYVAESGTGKTTLSTTLGRHWGYLSDETVGVTEDLEILPYPKPLSVRGDGVAFKKEHSPDEFGLLPAPPHPTVARVAVLRRDPEHRGGPRVEDLDLFDAVVRLAPQISALHELPHGLHRLRDLVDRTGPVLSIEYREAEDLVDVTAQLIGEA